jgi:gluconokinase
MIRLVVMGVSGSGKSTVGAAIADALSVPFIEGDALHPESNIRKMSAGIPLDDTDRFPWLDRVGAQLAEATGNGVIVSCSALKAIYRERLRHCAGGPLAFLYLAGSRSVLSAHMGLRSGHFMPLDLLDSQLATLEPPTGEPLIHTENIESPIEDIVRRSVQFVRTIAEGNATRGETGHGSV